MRIKLENVLFSSTLDIKGRVSASWNMESGAEADTDLRMVIVPPYWIPFERVAHFVPATSLQASYHAQNCAMFAGLSTECDCGAKAKAKPVK